MKRPSTYFCFTFLIVQITLGRRVDASSFRGRVTARPPPPSGPTAGHYLWKAHDSENPGKRRRFRRPDWRGAHAGGDACSRARTRARHDRAGLGRLWPLWPPWPLGRMPARRAMERPPLLRAETLLCATALLRAATELLGAASSPLVTSVNPRGGQRRHALLPRPK